MLQERGYFANSQLTNKKTRLKRFQTAKFYNKSLVNHVWETLNTPSVCCWSESKLSLKISKDVNGIKEKDLSRDKRSRCMGWKGEKNNSCNV